MRVPDLEPVIVFDADVEDGQRQLVETMDSMIPSEHTVDFLYKYDSAEELVGQAIRLTEGDLPPHQISLLRAIAGVFKSHADGDFGFDAATEAAAHTEAERHEAGVRRMRRMRVYVGRRSLWLASQPASEAVGHEAA